MQDTPSLAGRRGYGSTPSGWGTLAGSSPQHTPQAAKIGVWEDAAIGLVQQLVEEACRVYLVWAMPSPSSRSMSWVAWVEGATQNSSTMEHLPLSVKYLKAYAEWILAGFGSRSYILKLGLLQCHEALNLITVRLIFQSNRWFKAVTVWLSTEGLGAGGQEARFENVSLILYFIVAKLKNFIGCSTPVQVW